MKISKVELLILQIRTAQFLAQLRLLNEQFRELAATLRRNGAPPATVKSFLAQSRALRLDICVCTRILDRNNESKK